MHTVTEKSFKPIIARKKDKNDVSIDNTRK
jgi:hypothetical protein